MIRFKTKLVLIFITVLLLSSVLAMGMSALLTFLFMRDASVFRMMMMNNTLRQVLTLVYSVVIASIMIAAVTRQTLRPIELLSKAAQEMINGNFDVQVPENERPDEIGALQRNFNIMARELKGNLYLRKDFMSSISHELKTPLSAISAYAKLLHADKLSDEERLDYSCVIMEEAARLTNLTTSILKLSKLENQAIPENAREFSLDEQIRQVIMMLEPAWSAKNIELDIDLQECGICSDEELIRQVWQNLLDNAVKFTHAGGCIRVSLVCAEGKAKVAICDNGIGMNEEAVKRIFNQFYQGEPMRYKEGNGLGLTIVKRILDICGGTVGVKSERGRGSVFTVVLPEARAGSD